MNPRNVVMFSTSLWDSPHWFRRQHFAARLARSGWNVLYVEPMHTITTVLRTHGLRAWKPTLYRGMIRSPVESMPNLRVYTPPPTLPLSVRTKALAVLGRVVFRRSMQQVTRRMFGDECYAQVIYHPCDRYLLDPKQPSVYEIVDRFEGYPEYRRKKNWIKGQVRAAAEEVDTVTATTDQLAETVECAVPKVVIPNGVELEHYRMLGKESTPLQMEEVPRPRIVYVGALYEWFDFDLLTAVALALPKMSFTLIGFHSRPLPGLPGNVHYLGSKPWRELPQYLWACDAGIIPFRVDELTLHVDPLKFYEYMACDLPCVSTPMHTLNKYRGDGVLEIGDTPESVVRCLKNVLANREQGASRRFKIAQEHDWGALAKRFETELTRILDTDRCGSSY